MFFDGKTGQKVWSDGKSGGRNWGVVSYFYNGKSATREIIKDLKKRVEEGAQFEASSTEPQEQARPSIALPAEPPPATRASNPILSAYDYHQEGMKLHSASKFTQAENAFRDAVKIDPYNALYHHNLATVINAQQRYEEAEREIELAVRLAPNVEAYKKSLETVRSNRRRN